MAKVGRPTDYSKNLADEICSRLVEGESLRSICRSDGMPVTGTICRWLTEKPEFKEQYIRARENQADTLADEIIDIADDGSNDWMVRNGKDDDPVWQLNGEHVQRSRLRVDARKWVASKLKPKKYGDSSTSQITGKDGKDLFGNKADDEVNQRIIELLNKVGTTGITESVGKAENDGDKE